jgi:hypothetical protein
MDKSAIQKAVQWRMEKQAVSFGSGEGVGNADSPLMSAAKHPLEIWESLSPIAKRQVLGSLLGGTMGGGAGYLAGNSIVKDKDSSGMATAKRAMPAIAGAGLGAAVGGALGTGEGIMEKIPGMPHIAAEKALEWRIDKIAAEPGFFASNPQLTSSLVGTGLGAAAGGAYGYLTGSPEERAAKARKYAILGGGLGLGAGYVHGSMQPGATGVGADVAAAGRGVSRVGKALSYMPFLPGNPMPALNMGKDLLNVGTQTAKGAWEGAKALGQ